MDYIKIMKTLKEEYEKNHYSVFAIRGDNRPIEAGITLGASYDWDVENDIMSKDKLSGTSGVYVDINFFYDDYLDEIDTIIKAVNFAKENYSYKNWSVIAGTDFEYGQDDGEIIIEDAKVVVLI